MSKKSSKIVITDLVSININNYKGVAWLHIRRKEKTVSLTAKDFGTLIGKKEDIKKIVRKYERGKKRKYKSQEHTDTSESSDYADTD
jgi:hypothetical protein